MEKDARVKAMVPNHIKALIRKVALILLQNPVEVLIITRGRQQISIRASVDRQPGVQEGGVFSASVYHIKPWQPSRGRGEYFLHPPRRVPNSTSRCPIHN